MSELPKGWVESAVDEVGDISSGFGFPDRFQGNVAGELPFAKVRDISQAYQKNGGILSGAGNYVSRADLTALKARTVPAGSVAFAKIGEALKLNRRVLLDVEAVLDNNCMAVTPHQGLVEPKFLYRFLTTLDFAPFSVATTVPSIRKGDVGSIRLPLPPLAEQKRIVAKLEALNAKSARARTELARIETLVSRYKQAVLSKAFSGELDRKELGDLVVRIKAGKNLRCEERPPHSNEKGVVKVSAVTWGEFRADQSKTLPSDFEPDEDTRIRSGDFLFSRANTIDLVGAVVIVADAPDNLYLSDKILRLEFSELIDTWLLWYLRSPMGREALMNISSGNQLSMRNIGQKNLLSLSIPFADTELRNEIVRLIESAFAKIDRLAAEAKRALALVGRLDEAVLAKAFRGELVPQDENDEPATTLLARIRASRDAAPKVKRGRKARS